MAFGARSFNGTSDKVDAGTGVTNPTAISISAWFKTNSVSGTYLSIYSKDPAITGTAHLLALKNANMAYYLGNGAGFVSVDPGSTTISTGTWYHTVMTYDSTNGLNTFINGASDGTAAASGPLDTAGFGSSTSQIGADTANVSRWWNGSIADVGIWNLKLTAGEAGSLAKGVRPKDVRPASLIAYWPLDGVNSPEPDLSGFANNGTLTGTTNAAGPPLMLSTPLWVSPTDIPLAPPILMGQICL